jgi:hypothetical protein
MDSNFDPNWDSYDSGSSGPGLLDYFKAGSTTATGILGALNKPKTTTPAAGATNWTVIIGIGAAVFGLLLLVMFAKK